jgi:hypothetical protein
MSTMSQPIQTVEDIVPLSTTPAGSSPLSTTGLNSLKAPLRMLAGVVLSPVLILAAMFGFLVVLADFAFFRLQDVRDGHPHPKGLWEF